MTLAIVGQDGYAQQLERDSELGRELEHRLTLSGWRLRGVEVLRACITNHAVSTTDLDVLVEARRG